MDSANNYPLDTGQPQRLSSITTLDTASPSLAAASGEALAHDSMSSAPPTPSIRRTAAHAATSPIPAPDHSPRPSPALRRTSSSQSLNKPPSSPQLARKGSRASLGGTPDGKERRPTPKRSISNLIAGLREAQATMESIEEPVPLTAAGIAAAHFIRELSDHAMPECNTETAVIIHDACYGHRYSRLKATKTTLSMIVERPERLHASILGASTAYVRLGQHHAGGQRAPHPEHRHNPSVHVPPEPLGSAETPFKIRRSTRSMPITSSFVTNVHGTSWMSELQALCQSAPEKLAAGAKELDRETSHGEPERPRLHEGDLYLAPESLDAFQGALGGVADAVDLVFAQGSRTKRAFVAVRPPGHHCSADMPSGFCWLNNVHVGIEYAAQMYGLTHAAILDFDLHHGDGSQAIAWQRNSKNNEKRLNAKPNSKLKLGPDIGYYSIHDINSYPCEMGDDEKVQAASLCIENAHGQSIWNVHLQPWKTEEEFWDLYERRYSVLLEKAKNFLQHHDRRIAAEGKVPALSAIFISAGFDASEWEGSGMQRHKVNVPTEFYARITQDVVKLAHSLPNCRGRVISVLEGGYSDRALCSGVLSHLSGLCMLPEMVNQNTIGSLAQRINGLSIGGMDGDVLRSYDTTWWSAANMTALEHQVNPPPPPHAKKGRTGPQPTYATPTESFAYKVVDPQKFARSVSGTMREGQIPARPPTPPPPEVDWVVATQELSKLLIPTDRQTKSCTPEELAVMRTMKARQSAVATLPTQQAGQPRQLRDRRAKRPSYAESAHSDETASVRASSRAESRASRRETIDVLPSETPRAASSRRTSRRLSAGSALNAGSGSVDPDAPPIPKQPPSGTNGAMASSNMKPPPIPTPTTQLQNTKIRAPSKSMQTAGSTNPNDVDSLTSGMKRITLKVSTSKEEHDRKQKEKLDAERRARALKGAETRRINAAAKKAAKEAATQVPAVKKYAPVPFTDHARPKSAAGAVVSIASPVSLSSPGATISDPIEADIQPTAPNGSLSVPQSAATDTTTANAVRWGQVAHDSATSLPAADFRPELIMSPIAPADGLELPQGPIGNGDFVQDTRQNTNHADHTTNFSTRQQIGTDSLSSLPVHTPSNGPLVTTDWSKPSIGMPQPMVSSPSRPASSSKLPIWSSTGPIPFAPSMNTEPARQDPETRKPWSGSGAPTKW